MSREEEEALEHFIRITTPTTADRLGRQARGEPEPAAPKQYFSTFRDGVQCGGFSNLLRADWAHDTNREEIGDD